MCKEIFIKLLRGINFDILCQHTLLKKRLQYIYALPLGIKKLSLLAHMRDKAIERLLKSHRAGRGMDDGNIPRIDVLIQFHGSTCK